MHLPVFYAGNSSYRNSSSSSYCCTQWRCVLILFVMASAGTVGSLWVSITRDLANLGKKVTCGILVHPERLISTKTLERNLFTLMFLFTWVGPIQYCWIPQAEDPLSAALAYSLMVRLSQPLSSQSNLEETNLVSNKYTETSGNFSGRKKLHSREDNSISDGSIVSAKDLVAQQAALVKTYHDVEGDKLFARTEQESRGADDKEFAEKKNAPADVTVADSARGEAVSTANFPTSQGTTVGVGRPSGGTTFSKASNRRMAANVAAAAGKGKSLGVRSDGRMNVLMVVADDMRSQSMVYGKADTYTPSLARLAARGVVFDRAYAQVGGCRFPWIFWKD